MPLNCTLLNSYSGKLHVYFTTYKLKTYCAIIINVWRTVIRESKLLFGESYTTNSLESVDGVEKDSETNSENTWK